MNRPAEETTTGNRGPGGNGSAEHSKFGGRRGPVGEPLERDERGTDELGKQAYETEPREAYERDPFERERERGYERDPFERERYEGRGGYPIGEEPYGPRTGRPGQDKVFPLIRRVADEVTTLFSKELALLRVEMTSALKDTRTGIISVATGGAVAYAGLLMLLLAAVFGLATVMEPWLAALIVGGVVLLIGIIMLMAGKSKLEADTFKPEHTAASLQKDRDMIKRNIHESHNR